MPKKNNSLVSVIVTTFNRKEYLQETINSILNQTYKNYELIVVDNFSNYDFFELIEDINNEKIKAYQNQNNGVIAVNRNFGMSKSCGDFIAFCDDDDLWHSTKLERQLDKMISNIYGLCFTNFTLIDNNGAISKRQPRIKKIYQNLTFNKFILSGGCIINSSVMIRHAVVNTVGIFSEDPKIIAGEDFNYWSRILHQYSCCYVEQKLTIYRISSTSIQSQKAIDRLLKEIYVFDSIKKTISIKKSIVVLKYLTLFIRHLKNLFDILFFWEKT